MTAMMQDPEVVFLLLPMPLVRSPARPPQVPPQPPPGPYSKVDAPSPDRGGKGSRRGKGKGKSSGKLDSELKGLATCTLDHQSICFAYNTNGCTNAVAQNRCSRGVHVCMKCFEKHCQRTCPKG